MKSIKVQLFKSLSLAALLIAGASFTACSSSDDNIANEQPVNPATQKYTMTVKATKSDDASTRGLTLSGDGKTIGVQWYANEKVIVVQNDTEIGTLTPVAASSTGTVTLTGELDSEPTTDPLYFYLHQYGEDYSGQKGVLLKEDDAENAIEVKYDFAHTFITSDYFSVNGKQVSVPGGITLNSNQAIVKFTLVEDDGNGGTNSLNATSLTIEETGAYPHIINGPLTITPDGAKDVLYVAIRGINTNDRKSDLMLTATVGDYRYVCSKSNVVFEHGKYYAITVKMTKCKMAAAATTSDKGKLICTDGHIHAYNADAACTKTRVAKIIYVGATGNATFSHGLALAMSDASGGIWSASNGSAHTYKTNNSGGFSSIIEDGLQYNASHNSDSYPAFMNAIANNGTAVPTDCSGWFLPTGYQWQLMITAAGGFATLRDGFTSVGGTNMASEDYWSSTEWNGNNNMYAWGFSSYWNEFRGFGKDYWLNVRSALAF